MSLSDSITDFLNIFLDSIESITFRVKFPNILFCLSRFMNTYVVSYVHYTRMIVYSTSLSVRGAEMIGKHKLVFEITNQDGLHF